MTVLHDSHAIGAEHPPVLATLLDATRAVLTLLRNPAAGGQDAMDAIAAYVQAAGLEPNGVTERLITTVERLVRNPGYMADPDEILVPAAAFYVQIPDVHPLAARYATGTGFLLRPLQLPGHGAGGMRLEPHGTRIRLTVRQAVRRYGALARLDLLHAPVTHYDAAPGAEEPDAVYQVCAHDDEPWPCRVAVSAGIAAKPVAAPIQFATEAPF